MTVLQAMLTLYAEIFFILTFPDRSMGCNYSVHILTIKFIIRNNAYMSFCWHKEMFSTVSKITFLTQKATLYDKEVLFLSHIFTIDQKGS